MSQPNTALSFAAGAALAELLYSFFLTRLDTFPILAAGVLLDHEGIAAGSGIVIGNGGAVLGIGADGEELRLTCEDPAGGFVIVTFSYFTIES